MYKARILHNFKSNVPFLLLSALSLVLLSFGGLSVLPKWLWTAPAILLCLAAAAIPHILALPTQPRKYTAVRTLPAAVCAALCGLDIYLSLPQNLKWMLFFEQHAAWEIPILTVLVVLTVLVFTVLLSGIFSHIPNRCFVENPCRSLRISPCKADLKTAAFCLFTAFLVLTVCTKSSFLYPLNDWVDSNCFFTVGKAIANGKVLYADIYEQKGPLLYFLHALAFRVSPESFFGVYWIELFAAALFLFFTVKTVQLYATHGIYFWLPIFAMVVYSSKSFCHGDSVEELCLPLFMICIYLAERAFVRGETLPLRHWLFAGVLGGAVLWMKFNLLGFFVGWALIPLYRALRKDGSWMLCKAVFCVLAGALLPTVPVLIYFGAHHAFGDLWTAYFYNNLFLYADVQSEGLADRLLTLFLRIQYSVRKNYLYAVPGFAGVLWYFLTARRERKLHMLFAALGTTLLVFAGQMNLSYYSLVFSVFAVWGLVPLCQALERFLPQGKTKIGAVFVAASLCISLGYSYLLSSNTYLMHVQKEEMPQYKFKEIICSVENPTLLNYGFLDGGFYTTTGLVPENKYFCQLNIQLTDMYFGQYADVEAGNPDFVVTRSNPLKAEGYACVATASLYFEGVDFTYYLYAADRVLPQLEAKGILPVAVDSASE